ncbi:MAG TPA: MOSC domain-containing protein [Vicinamibacterales bacterium]|nr:MOSC domain-containing protein [Vicinamibacterales bacterium]
MRLISVNVGTPRTVPAGDRQVLTAIVKAPVAGPVGVKTLNVDGDRQADLRVHGGPAKAVYLYPHEHYAFWRGELPDMELTPGAFGENLTTEGVLETRVSPGDRVELGTAVFRVTTPRMPCFKLGIRFGRADMVKRFWQSGRCGLYLAVEREGQIQAGDEIRVVRASADGRTIADAFLARARAKGEQGPL